MAAFPGFEWDIVGDGQVWPFPEQLANHHQTWLREPATGRYRIDVFREPHVGGLRVCRRDASITLPYGKLILRTSEGIPYAAPEVTLLFKAKHRREKDEADFQRVLPRMNQTQRSRLISWLSKSTPATHGPRHSQSTGLDAMKGRGPPAPGGFPANAEGVISNTM